ncbi:hypothetical protein B5P43_17440 [Bacillus sp. SRB_336]|nr:hypothetical protein B5P43_17440 [Bacillus sp. SRB_336]
MSSLVEVLGASRSQEHLAAILVVGRFSFISCRRSSSSPPGSVPKPSRAARVSRASFGVDWSSRRDEWVGSRPVTPDGLPVVGPLASPRIFAAGGHGMWGIVLGPATGQLLAEQIMTGTVPPEIRNFDPLRP